MLNVPLSGAQTLSCNILQGSRSGHDHKTDPHRLHNQLSHKHALAILHRVNNFRVVNNLRCFTVISPFTRFISRACSCTACEATNNFVHAVKLFCVGFSTPKSTLPSTVKVSAVTEPVEAMFETEKKRCGGKGDIFHVHISLLVERSVEFSQSYAIAEH